jgi:hypothetical protein
LPDDVLLSQRRLAEPDLNDDMLLRGTRQARRRRRRDHVQPGSRSNVHLRDADSPSQRRQRNMQPVGSDDNNMLLAPA